MNTKADNIQEALLNKNISSAPKILAQFGKVNFCDEIIDDESDDPDDDYVMMRSYDVGDLHVKLYYGNNTRFIGCVETEKP